MLEFSDLAFTLYNILNNIVVLQQIMSSHTLCHQLGAFQDWKEWDKSQLQVSAGKLWQTIKTRKFYRIQWPESTLVRHLSLISTMSNQNYGFGETMDQGHSQHKLAYHSAWKFLDMRRYGGGLLYTTLSLHMQRRCFRILTHDQPVTKAQLYRYARVRPSTFSAYQTNI